MMHTGERIRELRLMRGMTQQELADALNYSRPAVVLWENGTRNPPLSQLRKISKILRFPLYELLEEWSHAEPQTVTTSQERALLEMYRQLPQKLRQKYVELFSASVGLREEGESRRDRADGSPVHRVGAA